jgi:hypothetical protein
MEIICEFYTAVELNDPPAKYIITILPEYDILKVINV